MADATSPDLVHPRTILSTKLTDLQTLTVQFEQGNKIEKVGRYLQSALVDDTEIYKDEAATVDTAATTAGEFWIELAAEITTLVARINFECLDLNVGFVPYAIGDYYVLSGAIAGFTLTRNEELTLDDSGATLQLVYGALYTIDADRSIVARLTSGTINADDAVATGGSSGGTLTFTAGTANMAGAANNRCPGIGGRLKVPSTGAAHASQSSVPVSYLVEGTKI